MSKTYVATYQTSGDGHRFTFTIPTNLPISIFLHQQKREANVLSVRKAAPEEEEFATNFIDTEHEEPGEEVWE